MRYAQGVANGQYENNEVFLGLIEAMVSAKERQARGKGMQEKNFLFCTKLTLNEEKNKLPTEECEFISHEDKAGYCI